MAINVGISAYNMAGSDLVELCRAADQLGFESLWLGEHVVLPLGYESDHPTSGTATHAHHKGPIIDPETILVDPVVALSAAAAVTTQMRLATGIYLLPLRHPLISARMVSTLHDVSGGRFTLGVGSGWLAEEFDVLDVPFAKRRARFDEAIAILRESWAGKPFEHHGEQFDFGRVQVCPTPITVPLVLGGNTEPALARAARLADGWFSSGTPSLEDAVALRDRLDYHRTQQSKHGNFSVHVRKALAVPDDFDRYEAEGLTNVVVWADQIWPNSGALEEKRAVLAAAADRLGVSRTMSAGTT